MKKKADPKSIILTIILIITYVLSVVFNFSHMSDSTGSRKPGFATAGARLSSALCSGRFRSRARYSRC